jgi:hypothetical protein
MEDNQASGAKVLSMSDEERTHLLSAALLILPLGHQLRSALSRSSRGLWALLLDRMCRQ